MIYDLLNLNLIEVGREYRRIGKFIDFWKKKF